MSFRPQYSHPVTLSQLNQLEPGILTEEIARLQHSISHLIRSNNELMSYCRPSTSTTPLAGPSPSSSAAEPEEELDEETRAEFEESIRENETTIASQRERLEMIRMALENQLGIDSASSHYDVAASSISPARGTPAVEPRAVEPSAVEPAEVTPPPLLNGGGVDQDALQDVDGEAGIYL